MSGHFDRCGQGARQRRQALQRDVRLARAPRARPGAQASRTTGSLATCGSPPQIERQAIPLQAPELAGPASSCAPSTPPSTRRAPRSGASRRCPPRGRGPAGARRASTSPPCASVSRTARSSPSSRVLHRRPVQRAGDRVDRRTAAGRAAERVPLHAVLVEQQLHPPSDAASSVSAQPDGAARVPAGLLAPARRRRSLSRSARHSSSSGTTTSRSSASDACASAVAQPITASATSVERTSANSARVSSPADDDDARPAERGGSALELSATAL